MWFCLCLVVVSLLAGALLGDRYQPFHDTSTENRLSAMEARMEQFERNVDRPKFGTVDAGK